MRVAFVVETTAHVADVTVYQIQVEAEIAVVMVSASVGFVHAIHRGSV